MAVSNIKVTFPCDIHIVWKVITDVAHSTWRSDVSRTEILNERQFVEYTKEGYATTFTTTVLEPFRQWEFEMENSNMKGHWTGVFKEKDGQTEIEFTEDVTAKKFWMRPFVRGFLKKQQKRYISDLRKALSDQ